MEGEVVKNREHPLDGVILCFTSIPPEQRTQLAEIAGQMGAIHKYDLTSDVTHLIVGEANTEKYKFVARERSDVLVLKPEWIEAVRQSWMEGGDTDLKALEQKYKLPTFLGLTICVTGFDDMSYRNYLEEATKTNGAEFSRDLTKNVTHLVAHQPSGPKYKFATQWQISVVTAKWFSDSLERGMILDETRYDPLLPPEEQGAGAWNRIQHQVSTKRKQPSSDSLNAQSRKLRRAASSKLGDQNEGIWGDIIGGGSHFSGKNNSTSVAKSNSIGFPTKGETSTTQQTLLLENEFFTNRSERNSPDDYKVPESKGFLQGCYFHIHGFTSKQVDILQHHLTVNGAKIIHHLNDFSSHEIPKTGDGLYIISSYKIPRSEVPSTDDKGFSCKLVTDMWLERCLDSKVLVPPEAHVTSTPFPRLPLTGFEGLKICSTGFAGIDLLHISKMIAVMGAKYEEYFTPSVSVLISNDPQSTNTEKLRHALEWGIPVVSADWLWISVQSGQKKVLEPYLIQKPAQQKDKHPTKVQTSAIPEMIHKSYLANSGGRARSQSQEGSLPATDSDNPISDINPPKRKSPTGTVTASKSLESHAPQPMEGNNDNASLKGLKSISEERKNSTTQSHSTSDSLGLSMNGLLKQARELTRARSVLAGENGNRRRRPNLGRTTSRASVSSIDTLNEDGYGSALSTDADTSNPLTGKLSRNFTGQSLSSLLSGSKFTKYIDSPIHEDDDLLDDENGTPAMTQLNYEDPDAMAMREEIMRLARRGNVDEALLSEKLKQKEVTQPQVIVDELPPVVDKSGGHTTNRRTRRSNGKQQEEDFL